MNGIPSVRHHDVCTCAKCNTKANRIAAFGAIRRAAKTARQWDTEAEREWPQDASDAFGLVAMEIRTAIRAAIGSDKT